MSKIVIMRRIKSARLVGEFADSYWNVSYRYMLDECEKNGNRTLLKKLKNAPPTMSVPLPKPYLMLRDVAMHSLGVGTTHDMKSVLTGIFLPVWLDKEYTIKEKLNIWKGKWSSDSKRLWNQMLGTDLTNGITQLDIPVYFLYGKYDYTISYTGTRSYFKKLSAPVKGFYTYEISAHSPIFEEPEKTLNIMKTDVLSGTNNLADKIE